MPPSLDEFVKTHGFWLATSGEWTDWESDNGDDIDALTQHEAVELDKQFFRQKNQ